MWFKTSIVTQKFQRTAFRVRLLVPLDVPHQPSYELSSMILNSHCKPRPSVFVADRRATVLSEVGIANLCYRESVEDRVHQALPDRLEAIHELFGQIPDTLEDVWVQKDLRDEAAAHQLIDRTIATRNPFDFRYSKVEDADWETCSAVLNKTSVKELMFSGWKSQ